MFCQAPVTNNCTLNCSLHGNLPGSIDKQHGKHDKHEKVNETDSLQPSGCNKTDCVIKVALQLCQKTRLPCNTLSNALLKTRYHVFDRFLLLYEFDKLT